MSNHFVLKMQIVKVLNPHPLSKEEFIRDFCARLPLEFSGKCFVKTFRRTRL